MRAASWSKGRSPVGTASQSKKADPNPQMSPDPTETICLVKSQAKISPYKAPSRILRGKGSDEEGTCATKTPPRPPVNRLRLIMRIKGNRSTISLHRLSSHRPSPDRIDEANDDH